MRVILYTPGWKPAPTFSATPPLVGRVGGRGVYLETGQRRTTPTPGAGVSYCTQPPPCRPVCLIAPARRIL